jgi:Na+/H+ antiporter NhaD/arsenite permease-like protein
MDNFWITLIIVSLVYIGLAIGFIPRLQSNRTTITLYGVGALLVLRQIQFKQIGSFLDLDTLILLFSMMVINTNLRLSGFFKLAGAVLLRLTRKPRVFLLIEIFLVGFLSALFLNDTICIMFTPFLLDLLLAIDRNPIPYLIALATASNIGSVATLTGNPQNMIIGIASGISYINFSAALAPIALISLGVIWIILILVYKKEFSSVNYFNIPPTREVRYFRPLLVKTLIVTGGLLTAFLLGVPIALASLIAAVFLLFTRRVKPVKIFSSIDWEILVFFSGLFIVTGSLETNGITAKLGELVEQAGNITAVNLSIITTALSNLVSNVPAVLLLKPLISQVSNPIAGWLTLAASSTLAGNLTLLGSVANLIVAESAGRRHIKLAFWEYTRVGAIITLITLVISTGWLVLFVWK